VAGGLGVLGAWSVLFRISGQPLRGAASEAVHEEKGIPLEFYPLFYRRRVHCLLRNMVVGDRLLLPRGVPVMSTALDKQDPAVAVRP